MNEVTILDKHQTTLLDRISADRFFTNAFYFSGGTALSEVYLKHRDSVDLDFFSPREYDPKNIQDRLTRWSDQLDYTLEITHVESTHIYLLSFTKNYTLKIDFSHYPYQQLEAPVPYKDDLQVDSLYDIAVNKLITLTQRSEVKDFVDLYFLLQQFSFWDLRGGVKTKFSVDLEPFIFASDCMVVEEFDYMPKMHKHLRLEELRNFFLDLAKRLGRTKLA